MAVDGDLQQPASLYHHPDPACGCMVCPLRLVGSAQFDFGAMSFFEYRYAAAEISWLSANHAPTQLKNLRIGAGVGCAGTSADE